MFVWGESFEDKKIIIKFESSRLLSLNLLSKLMVKFKG